jgi:putative addiction module component (TIGR02574 family)
MQSRLLFPAFLGVRAEEGEINLPYFNRFTDAAAAGRGGRFVFFFGRGRWYAEVFPLLADAGRLRWEPTRSKTNTLLGGPMTSQTQALFDAAMALSEDERWLLVERLMETLPPPPNDDSTEEEFAAELDRRAAEIAKDPSLAIPWKDVLKDE